VETLERTDCPSDPYGVPCLAHEQTLSRAKFDPPWSPYEASQFRRLGIDGLRRSLLQRPAISSWSSKVRPHG
jgi:hypothetical protein